MRIFVALNVVVLLSACAGQRSVVPSLVEGHTIRPQVAQNGHQPLAWRTFPVSQSQDLLEITAGSDDAIWASSRTPPGLLRVSMQGKISFVSLPYAAPVWLVGGPDGRVWMTDNVGGGVFDIAAYDVKTHVTTAYYAGGPSGDSIVTNPIALLGGRVWFTEQYHIASITRRGHVTEYALPSRTLSPGQSLIATPNDQIWAAAGSSSPPEGGFVTVDPRTGATKFVPLAIGSTPCFPTLAAGRDFVYGFCGNYFLRIDPRTLHVRSYGPFKTNFYGMVVGPNGIVYFAVGFPNVLGVFDPRRGVIQYAYTPNGDGIGAVVIGPDGNVWSVMGATWAIGVYILNVLDVKPASVELPGAGAKATLNATFTGRGPLGASTSNPAVATVAPGTNTDAFVVTAVASGEAVVTVADRRNNTFAIRVAVGRT